MKLGGLLLIAILIPAGWIIANGCSGPTSTHVATHAATHASTSPAEAPAATRPTAAEVRVVIDNFRFNPREMTVTAGTQVTWVNNDDVPHTATSSAKPRIFDSRTLDTDGKFSYVFTTPGTYDYFCAVHPHMTGRIIVK